MKLSRTASYNLASIGLAIALACGTIAAQADPPHPLHYTVTDLGTLPGGDGFSLAYGINNQGQIDGTSLEEIDGNFVLHSFVIETRTNGDRQMIDLGTLGGQNSQSFSGLNASGVVGGESELATPDPNNENFCGFGYNGPNSTSLACVGFIWKDGVRYGLAGLGGTNSSVSEVNNQGLAAGYAETMVPDTACPLPQVLHYLPVVWRGLEVSQKLPLYQGDTEGGAFWMNNRDDVVGASGVCSAYNSDVALPLQPMHALLWRGHDGRVIDLGSLGGHFFNSAFAIDDRGDVVGASDLPNDTSSTGTQHAFLWRHGKMTDLGTLPGDVQSAALAINNRGQITGVSIDSKGNITAILWQGGKKYNLNDLAQGNPPMYLLHGFGINDKGQIVGFGQLTNGDVHAFVATPVPDDDQAAVDGGIRKTARLALPARTRALIAKWMRASHVHGVFAAPPLQPAGALDLTP